MPGSDETKLNHWQRDVARQTTLREKAARAVADHTAEIDAQEAQAARLTALGDLAGAAAVRAGRDRLAAERAARLADLARLNDELRDVLDRGPIAFALDPGDADPAVPLALFPVRLETRFTEDGRKLRVRIFPDDIHIDSLDRGISEPERAAASEYWTAVWRASQQDASTAWRLLLARVGKLRASWVTLATRPKNIDRQALDAKPEFADTPPPRSRRAAVARLLPDAFTVVVVQGETRSSQTGRAVLPEVVVGLFAGDGSELKEVNGMKLTAGAEWLADYAEAERAGMAITVQLPRQGRVDRLLVYGVRRSLDANAAASELEALLQAHRCSQGLAFVPQGTPTNNTETDRAGWQRTIEPRQPPPVSTATSDANSNSAILAAALGMSAQVLTDIDHADEREQSRARAMNVAMWRPSWGGFLEKINKVGGTGATLSDGAREQTRRFHRDHVRGRGPLPALRIGDQPYGILPVSAASRWRTDRGDAFETKVRDCLDRLRKRWLGCVAKVPRMGAGPIDDVLLELLGSSPVCLSLRVRQIISSPFALLGAEANGADPADLEVEHLLEGLLWEELFSGSLVDLAGSFGESRPLSLPLVHESDPGFIDALIANSSPSVKSVFQALVELAWDRAQRDVEKDSAGGLLAAITANATALSTADRERTLALAQQADTTDAATLFSQANRVAATIEGRLPTLVEYQPVASVSRSFGELALESTNAQAREQLSLFGVHSWLNSRGRFNELRDALSELHNTSLDERRILFAEALDLASHRLDAWITAVVDRRLKTMRAARPSGLTIGAYGWVEEIEPARDRTPDGGFVHAPNIAHAATAAVLRSGYLSHNADLSGEGAFAIDLTSARVRTALHLVDGIRQGQPLGALLGYRIERGLHEAQLDRFVLSLRAVAPLTQGLLSDRGETLAPSVLESVAAANVLDGIGLIERYQGKVAGWSANAIRARVAAPPSDNPYLSGVWQPPTDAEWAETMRIIEEASVALDAVSDLLLAESVHMLVAGNPARAAAALDAAGGGDAPPPEPQFVNTPWEGTLFTHKLLAVAGEGQAWNTIRPRSAAEPRLEVWAAERLGDPASIAVADGEDGTLITAADTGLCALDFVYEAGNREAFEQLLRATLPAIQRFHDSPRGGWPAGTRAFGDVFECAASLRALLVKARPATPLDLGLANASSDRAISASEIAAARVRAQDARDLLNLRCTMLEALLSAAASPAQLRAALKNLTDFGLSVPPAPDEQLSNVGQLLLANARRNVENATKALAASSTAESVAEAGQAIFGEGFWILPAIEPPAATDLWIAALAAPPPGASPAVVRRFLIDFAAVRDGVRRFVESMLLAEAIGGGPILRVAQLTGAYGVAPSGWVGDILPVDAPTPTTPVLSAVLDIAGAYDGTGATVALVLDEWVERLPIRERRGAAPDAQIDERVTTGVSFNAMAPSARAPQAILLAVSPNGARWTGDAVVATLEETLELAKLRTVTLERTNGIARILPALFEQSWSLQGEKVFNFAVTADKLDVNAAAIYVKEGAK
jgi:hypothetical protein